MSTNRSLDKSEAILDAAEQVFAQYGYHGAQIAKIAPLAGVAVGTVYLYFKSKSDVLVALFRDRLGKLIAQACEEIAGIAEPEERLRRLIALHLNSLAASPDLATVTQIELRQADLDVQQQITEVLKGYFDVLDQVIIAGQEAGTIRTDVDRLQMRNMIFGTLDQTVTAWVMAGRGFDLPALAEPSYRLIAGGLLKRKEA
ncbi:MAG: TetR/AcrR family transcriptional regulator [Mycobacterium leprae]